MIAEPIYILHWVGNFMGWSYNKEDLHKWAKNLDATWTDGEKEEGTEYVIVTAYPGFDPDTHPDFDEESFDIVLKS